MTAVTINTKISTLTTKFWFFLTCFIFIVHYGRLFPPAFEVIRPFALMSFMLVGIIFLSKKDIFQVKYQQMGIIYSIIAIMIISIPMSVNYGHAFSTTRSIMMYLPFMLSVIILMTDVTKLRTLVNVIILTTALNVINGYMSFEGAHRNTMFNLGAFLTDPNDYALYMNMMLPFCYFMFLHEKNWNVKKILFGVLSACTVMMVILSHSRGGMVGLVATSFIILLFSPKKIYTFSAAGIALIAVMVFSGDDWKDSMSTTTDMKNSTTNERLDAWTGSVKIFMNNPILGIGPMNTPYHINKYIPGKEQKKQYGYASHSIWFTSLAESGIIGFTLFLMLIYLNLKNSWKLTKIKMITPALRFLRYYGIACFASLIAFLAGGSFLTVNYYPHIWYLTAFIIVGIKLFDIETKRVAYYESCAIHQFK